MKEEDERRAKERAGMSLSRENREGSRRNGSKSKGGSKSIIRLANDLQACTGYKGNQMKRTRDQLANETTGVKGLTQGGGFGQGRLCREISSVGTNT